MEHWPKKGLREIDALLITHPHAVSASGSPIAGGRALRLIGFRNGGRKDAILGLDDLRGICYSLLSCGMRLSWVG